MGHSIFPFFRGKFASIGFNEDCVLNHKRSGSHSHWESVRADEISCTNKGSEASLIFFPTQKYKPAFSKQCQIILEVKTW